MTEGQSTNREREVEDRSRGGGQSDSFKTFLSAAVDVIKESSHSDSGSSGSGQKFALDGLLGVLSNQVKETTRNPDEKARLISPEIKEKVGNILQEQHAPLAEQFTKIALDHIKKWLRGNTSTRDLGDGLKGEITDMVSSFAGMFGKKKKEEGTSRGISGEQDGEKEEGHGFSNIISEKLSTGLAKVHREVRLEFRSVLGGIEKSLFEALPDQFQGPLEKILGGNPFDESLGSLQYSGSRGLGDDLKDRLVEKIRNLVRKVQETLRQHILTLVNGGHRKFERQSWVFVQEKVESKIQKYLPNVRINVPDDIGNEGVSVGKPQESATMVQPPQNQSLPPQHSHQQSYPYYSNVTGQAQQYHAPSSHRQPDFGYSSTGGNQPYYGGPPPQQPYDQQQQQDYRQG